MAGGGGRFPKVSGTWGSPGTLRFESFVEYTHPGDKTEDKSLQLWRGKGEEKVMRNQLQKPWIFSSDAECRTWRVPGVRGDWSPRPHSQKPFHGKEIRKFTQASGVHRWQLRITSVEERVCKRAEDQSRKPHGGPSTAHWAWGGGSGASGPWGDKKSLSIRGTAGPQEEQKAGFTVSPQCEGQQRGSATAGSQPPLWSWFYTLQVTAVPL